MGRNGYISVTVVILLLSIMSSWNLVKGEDDDAGISYEGYAKFLDQDLNTARLAQDKKNALIGSFNTDGLNFNKLGSTKKLKTWVNIFNRYDIIVVQKIFDRNAVALTALLAGINYKNVEPMAAAFSPHSKKTGERYAIYYKKLRFVLEKAVQYKDKEFSRPPLAYKMKYRSREAPSFGILSINLSYSKFKKEIYNITLALNWAKSTLGVEDIVLMGSFYTGCGRFSQAEWDKLDMYRDGRQYQSLLPMMGIGTTIDGCAHDKIIVTGKELPKNVIRNSGNIFRYDEAFNVNPSWISTHFPVEFVFR